MRTGILTVAVAIVSLAAVSCGTAPKAAAAAAASGPVIPDGLGVNIHFTDPKAGEMKMIADAGMRIIRMDFAWNGTEREKGKYDFTAYDRLIAALEPHGIRSLFILDYSNKNYDNGLSPCSAEGRRAFAQWAAAAVQRFKGRKILWEMYNEPNIFFWKPKPDVRAYTLLALEVGKAIRAVAPDEAYIGPATSEIDFAFLEECFKAGLLEYWSAVSVHPYRQQAPETVTPEYARLRRMIDQYAPKGKVIAIHSGEWGYSAAWGKYDETTQGKMLPRQWMVNLANDVPVSIWYDWHDDGQDPKEAEHHFGTVSNPYFAGREPVYDPKPAYKAAKTLTTVLAGCRFSKRLAVGGPDDYVMLFAKGADVRLAVWTTAATPHNVTVPASPGKFAVTGHTGESLPAIEAGAAGLTVSATDSPQYLVPEKPNSLLRLAAAWERVPSEIRGRAQKAATLTLTFENPLAKPVRVASGGKPAVEVAPGGRVALVTTFDAALRSEPVVVRAECQVEGMGRLVQETRFVPSNPLKVTLLPPGGKTVAVRVENPSGEAFKGMVRLTDLDGIKTVTASTDLSITAGEREKTVHFALEGPAAATYRLGARIEDEKGDTALAVPAATFTLVADFARLKGAALGEAYEVHADGDPKVASTQSVSLAAPAEGPPAAGVPTLKVAYEFEPGWKFARLAPKTEALKTIDGQPKALGMWVYGDGSGCQIRLRFSDSGAQFFQPNGEAAKWKGWRYVIFPLDGTHAGHWGGANDGVIKYPIRWDTLLLIDNGGRSKVQGGIYIGWPVLIK